MSKIIIGVTAPAILIPQAFENRGGFIRASLSRHALLDFNEQAFNVFNTHDTTRTTFYIGQIALDGLNAYQKYHALKSRNKAVLAILATVYARDHDLPSPKNKIRLVEKTVVSVPKITACLSGTNRAPHSVQVIRFLSSFSIFILLY